MARRCEPAIRCPRAKPPGVPVSEPTTDPVPRANPTADLEIKDAQLIFPAVWADLLEQHAGQVRFPTEFIWLGGAPGAGKGTNTPFIASARDITAAPVVISNLLTAPHAVALK